MKTNLPLCIINTRGFLSFLTFFLISLGAYAQPVNDNCSAATILTENATCSNLNFQALKGATSTAAVPGTCGNASSADVWYSFVATSHYPIITISSLGSSLKAAIPIIQLLSGSCASFTSLGCITGTATANSLVFNSALAVGGSGLTIGATYYIRIYTNTNTGIPAGNNWTFSICVADAVATAATVDYGKSYVNVTKGTNGGTIEPGDILEIRATFVVRSNIAYTSSFTDNIPLNTTYIPGTLRVLTNEGKIYQQFTDASGDDAGTITGSAVTINLGAGANSVTGGSVANTSKPSFYGATCIMIASYRVTVSNAIPYGTAVPVGYGTFTYRNSTLTTTSTITFPADTIIAYKNYGICSNTVGANAIISEFGGTFGSGNIKDRAASSKVPSNYTYSAFSSTAGMPNDYYYGVSNNTSGGTTAATGYSILNTWAYPDNSQSPSHRIFSVWDIIGDHTGAINPLLGNPATDDNAGTKGGYMVVINASYRTDTAFLDTIYNLCPSTYYQYTAWFRNICSKCGCDSNGTGATGSGYIPTAAADSSGVHPNLTFNINGYDYYTTGDIKYSGQWVQKGFTYETGPTQTSMIINIRNNAPGGGGNDWAIDDIGVATCSPNMILTPNKPDTLCIGSDDTVRFQVNSFFNNYIQWQLQQSTDGGVTWGSPGIDTTGQAASGSSVPVYNSTDNQYEYTVARYYRLLSADTSILYRITVASTTANLSNSNCAFATATPKLVKGVNCMVILPANFISFKGELNNDFAMMQWVVSNELANTNYIIERSYDQVNYEAVGNVEGNGSSNLQTGYHFTDSKIVSRLTYYRIKMVNNGYYKYSNIILISNTTINFDVHAVVNPFNDFISFEMTAPNTDVAVITLTDIYGRTIKIQKQSVMQGLNNIKIYDLGNLPSGTYILQVRYENNITANRVIKLLQ